MQIEDGQVQGPELSACTPYLVPKPSASLIKQSNNAVQVPAPPPCPATPSPIPPRVSEAGPCSGRVPAASMSGVGVRSADGQIQVHYPTPVATVAPCPPMIFEGGALAREYPVGGAMAFCAVAIALAMI